jgi:hypothetical protein
MKSPSLRDILRALFAIGFVWFAVLLCQYLLLPSLAIDAVVTPSALNRITAEEKTQIRENIRRVSVPGLLSWLGAVAAMVLSRMALRKLQREGRS